MLGRRLMLFSRKGRSSQQLCGTAYSQQPFRYLFGLFEKAVANHLAGARFASGLVSNQPPLQRQGGRKFSPQAQKAVGSVCAGTSARNFELPLTSIYGIGFELGVLRRPSGFRLCSREHAMW